MPSPTCTRGEVIGRADDGDGVEALVVSIDEAVLAQVAAPTISPGRWIRRRADVPSKAMT